uniref:Uncharacterized protein n=1 Tax=Panagrolaimus sp. ES5 TaxID=591445 RepID=A0AC34FE21_9BILA
MGRHIFFLSSILLLLFITFPCFIEGFDLSIFKTSKKCDVFKKCTPIADWHLNPNDTGVRASKTCDDACAGYFCIVNGAVIYGGGCYSDFKETCTGSTAVTQSIDTSPAIIVGEKKMETGNFVYVCKTYTDNCLFDGIDFKIKLEDDFFNNEFIGGVSSNPDGCSPPKPTTVETPPPVVPSNTGESKTPPNVGFMNQINGFKLFVMILLGFIFAQFS